jgi:iron(III) transport system ATP-binding protein
MISIQNLQKRFLVDGGEKVAVDDLSLEIQEGEFFTLLGPSGCGKTTTLRCVAGLEKPTAGRLAIGGRLVYDNRLLVPVHDRDLGMVFQSYAVWPHMSVADNVAFPLTVGENKPPKKEVRKRVEEVLDLVGLEGLGGRMATQLSGGQQQRLSLARALVRSPQVLLLDEPLSNLDAKLRDRMRTELRAIQQRVGITTLFVTHDQVEALSMSDRVAVMRDGRIEQLGTPQEIYHEPRSAFVAEFIGGANLFPGTVTGGADGFVTASTSVGSVVGVPAHELQVGDRVVAAIRLEDAILEAPTGDPANHENAYRGVVGMRLFNGSSVDTHVSLESSHLQVRLGSRSTVVRGDVVTVRFPKECVRILPAQGEDAVLDATTTQEPAWARLSSPAPA